MVNQFDSRVSLAILRSWSRFVSSSRWPHLLLEWSAHGVPWLAGSALVFAYVCRRSEYSPETRRKFALLTLGKRFRSIPFHLLRIPGILLDLIAVGVIKLSVRRQRPPYNRDDQIYEAPVADQYSFPSGHTSRAAMLAILTIELCGVRRIYSRLFVYTLPVLLGISRIAMGRHYFSDVIGGLVLGAVEALVVLEIPAYPLAEAIKLVSGFLARH
ncbi:Presqualene diphosphate phosphatase [Aphelenchoides fujianensis]|nr:Presqualene diphosphate phosphatase [Aphelenchoides fujianensis]